MGYTHPMFRPHWMMLQPSSRSCWDSHIKGSSEASFNQVLSLHSFSVTEDRSREFGERRTRHLLMKFLHRREGRRTDRAVAFHRPQQPALPRQCYHTSQQGKPPLCKLEMQISMEETYERALVLLKETGRNDSKKCWIQFSYSQIQRTDHSMHQIT